MSKKLIRLTEGDLHNIINESVNNILKEYFNTPYKDFNNDDDVNTFSTFNPIDSGYISDKSFEDFLSEKYDELYTKIYNQINEMRQAFKLKSYRYFRTKNLELFEWAYSSYEELINDDSINDEVDNVLFEYDEYVKNNYNSSFETNNNDYEYPNKNYDDSLDSIGNIGYRNKLAKKILFDVRMMDLIKNYFNLKKEMVNILNNE